MRHECWTHWATKCLAQSKSQYNQGYMNLSSGTRNEVNLKNVTVPCQQHHDVQSCIMQALWVNWHLQGIIVLQSSCCVHGFMLMLLGCNFDGYHRGSLGPTAMHPDKNWVPDTRITLGQSSPGDWGLWTGQLNGICKGTWVIGCQPNSTDTVDICYGTDTQPYSCQMGQHKEQMFWLAAD